MSAKQEKKIEVSHGAPEKSEGPERPAHHEKKSGFIWIKTPSTENSDHRILGKKIFTTAGI